MPPTNFQLNLTYCSAADVFFLLVRKIQHDLFIELLLGSKTKTALAKQPNNHVVSKQKCIYYIEQEFRGRHHRTCWRKSHRSHNQNVVIEKVYFILSSAYLENWIEKNVDKVPNGAHIFLASAIPSNGYIFSTEFSY